MKKIKNMILSGIILLLMTGLTGCGTRTVNLNDYVSIDISGYDTMGTATCHFDYDTFNKDYEGKIKVKKGNNDLSSEMALAILGLDSAQSVINVCVDWNLDKSAELSNGDTITLSWNCDDESAKKYFGCKLKYSDIKKKVEGLEQIDTINPFDYVDVSFSGTSPQGTVTITPNYDQPEMQYVTFSADKNNGLKTGDVVTVTATVQGSEDDFIARFGVALGKKEETYTVERLAKYVTDISEIPEELYNKMDQQLQDNFKAYAASNWVHGYDVEEFTQIGNYLLTLKDGMFGMAHNYLYYVYRVTLPADEEVDQFTYYWYGYFPDVMLLEDGTCTVDLSNYTVSESESVWGMTSGDYLPVGDEGKYYVAGYADLDTLFNQQIVSRIDSYEYKENIQK